MTTMKTIILGAGLAGLELGRQLKSRGEDFLILEQEAQIGGLARTVKTGDYFWDFGVHALYSPFAEMNDYYRSLPLNYQESRRQVKILHTGPGDKTCLVDYPFEEGVRDLPWPHRLECLWGYIRARSRRQKQYAHLEDWILHGLGGGIAKYFMIPYNQKIWNCELTKISMDLVSSKIHPASVKSFISSVLGKKVVGRVYQARFVYPREGIQALMNFTARDFVEKIVLNARVEKLERKGDRWIVFTKQGREEAQRVISTIPLVDLLSMIDCPGLAKEYPEFRYNNTHFVMVGLKPGRAFNLLGNCHWAFLKEDEIFYRLTMMHNFSNQFLPATVVEITQKGQALEMTRGEIMEKVVNDLLRRRVIESRQDVAAVDAHLVRCTYPIPTVGLPAVKAHVTQELQKQNIFLAGRSGHWDYINMDGVIRNVRGFVEQNFSQTDKNGF